MYVKIIAQTLEREGFILYEIVSTVGVSEGGVLVTFPNDGKPYPIHHTEYEVIKSLSDFQRQQMENIAELRAMPNTLKKINNGKE